MLFEIYTSLYVITYNSKSDSYTFFTNLTFDDIVVRFEVGFKCFKDIISY